MPFGDDVYLILHKKMTVFITVGRRKVEVLLQRMFEDELDPEDIGAEEGLADDEDQPPRRYSFHMFGAI